MPEMNPHGRTMEDLGEKAFLADLLPKLSPHPSFLNGFGDDASVISIGEGRAIAFKIDRAAAPVAARRGWTDYRMWGRLAVTSNCSDILAIGSSPVAVMIAMILPRDWPVSASLEVIEGCAEECDVNNIAFAGGDTKEGQSAELIGSAIGVTEPSRMFTRRGSKPGDLLVLAGTLGGFLGSYLQILQSVDDDGRLMPSCERQWIDYISYPRARWHEAAFMRETSAATGAMDTSDGLYDAVSTLTSSYGADIDLELLPYHHSAVTCADRLGIPLINLGLGVGDWNIVYAVDKQRWTDIEAETNRSDLELTVIGTVTEERRLRWRDAAGAEFSCRPVVNQHFRARQEDEGSLIARLRYEQMLHPMAE